MISFKFGKGGGHFCGLLVFTRFMPLGMIFMNSLLNILNKDFVRIEISWQEIHKQSTKIMPLQIPGINDFTLVTFCLTLSLKKAEELH